MLSLFRYKKKEKSVCEDISQDRIAKVIVNKLLRLQHRWAIFMQHHTERLSVKRKISMLFFFCLCGAGFSFLLIAKGFMSNNKISFQVTQFQNSQHIGKSGDEKITATSMITKEEFGKVQSFKQFMDSLNKSPSGKRIYDSILISRPGLMDSIILLENIYQSQIKK